MNKFIFTLFSVLIFSSIYSQPTFHKVLVDGTTFKPISYAHIYSLANTEIKTYSNKDGQFNIEISNSTIDSIAISHLGYKTIKLAHKDFDSRDTIELIKASVELDQIVIHDQASILKKVQNKLAQNYPSTEISEQFFIRYFAKQNDENFQLAENAISTIQSGYFSHFNREDLKIMMHANNVKQNETKDRIEYLPYPLHKLVAFSQSYINLNDGYVCTTENLTNNLIKITFVSIDSTITNTGQFKGHLIVNLSDYSILEYYYQKEYNGKIVSPLKKKHSQKPIHHSVLRIWDKDNSQDKYTLKLMVVKDDSEVVNSGNNKTYIYKSTCQIQNVNSVLSDKNHTSKKVKNKKSLINYKNLNLELLEKLKPIVVTKTVEQESFR